MNESSEYSNDPSGSTKVSVLFRLLLDIGDKLYQVAPLCTTSHHTNVAVGLHMCRLFCTYFLLLFGMYCNNPAGSLSKLLWNNRYLEYQFVNAPTLNLCNSE
jgi:hypothetical protein